MSAIAYKKGKDLERQVEQILKQNSIKYQKQKRITGFGKRWLVDFYLPNPPTIIECKNIYGLNLRKHLETECVKFLDIRNRFFQMNFILVFPKPDFSMGSFARFCVKYNIKLATLDILLDSLRRKIDEVNSEFGKLTTSKTQTIKVIRASGVEGITAKTIMKKLGWHGKYPHIPFTAWGLVNYGIVKSILCPIRYFTKQNYERSKEFKFIEDLKMNYLNYSDKYFAEKYGFTIFKIRHFRLNRLGLRKKAGHWFKGNRNTYGKLYRRWERQGKPNGSFYNFMHCKNSLEDFLVSEKRDL